MLSRQLSIQGSCQVRGSPPPTSWARSRNGFGTRPGASATRTRPITSTYGTSPAAHWLAAVWADRNPWTWDRATSNTGAGAADLIIGQQWSVADQVADSAASDDSPAPPWVPTTHRSAGPDLVTLRSRSWIAGTGMPRCGVIGPVGYGIVSIDAVDTSVNGAAERDTHGLGSRDMG